MSNIINEVAALRQSMSRAKNASKYLKGDNQGSLTKDQLELVKSVWGNVHIDSRWMIHFNQYRETGQPWTPYYVPDNIQYGIIDLYYSNYRNCRIIEDKNLNDLLFSQLIQPKTLIRKESHKNCNSLYLDKDYRIVSREQVLCCLDEKNIIVKPSINSGGGRGICVFEETTPVSEVMEYIDSLSDVIVQEIVPQHEIMAALNPTSLNTIRIITFIADNTVRILSSIVRMGGKGELVDNASSGGLFCGIREDGSLKETAYNLHQGKYCIHPDSGVVFKDFVIPNFNQCLDIVRDLAPRFVCFSRLISWDMAIRSDGAPMLIESNMTYGGCNIPQIANGPLFGDYTQEVIKEVFSHRRNILLSKII